MGRAQQIESLWSGLTNNSGDPLAGGKVYTYAAGTTTDKATYTASDKSASATNPIILDAYGRAQIWADGSYKFVVKTSADATLYTLDNQVYGYDDGELIWGGTSAGTANAQTISVGGSITAYAAGQRYAFLAGNANTSTCTLNVNSIGAVSIVKGPSATGLASGDIRSGQIVDVIYETGGGGRFRLLSPIYNEIQNGSAINGGTSGGTANAQTLSLTPTLLSYSAGQMFRFIPGNANTGATTLNIDGLGAKDIYYKGYACVGGEILTTVPALVIYDGTQFELVEHAGGVQTWTPTLTPGGSMTAGSTTIDYAYYQRHGPEIQMWTRFRTTFGGTANGEFSISLPAAGRQTGDSTGAQYFTCYYDDATVANLAAFTVNSNANSTNIRKVGIANWSLAAHVFGITARYRTD